MNKIADHTESIFAAAVVIASVPERQAYVHQACDGDAELLDRINALLRAHDRAGHFFDQPVPGGPENTLTYPQTEQAGSVFAGRYKLLEEIGEGGMGSVWVAEQTEPVRRKVAVKLIKPGMDSKTVLARFEAERQALAVMNHPNIAKVLDGGLTESGRPYFVMEYVKGIPITEYCDAMRLSVPERLDLFIQVCGAVQHAHQKGIIHRDLKPSNILVAPYDDKPVPKVIDFGLAKAMNQSLTERTLHTAHETVLGTPIYMSPEQAQLNNLDVDTRSDLYSLGVLLYELLTGSTPLEKQRFKQAGWDEVRRIIREEEPPRPSTRISSCQTLPSLAAGRRTEPIQLTNQVRGELDWIVMKALEKDRNRRYETANGFALDLQRYLNGEPVLAAPPSTSYWLQKLARKHRAALISATLFALFLIGGGTVSIWQAVRATRAESQALAAERQAKNDRALALNQQKLAEERETRARENEKKAQAAETAAKESDATAKDVLNFVRDKIFAAARPPLNNGGLGKDVTLRQALDEAETKITESFAKRPRVEARLRSILDSTYAALGETQLAGVQIERAFALAKQHYGVDDEFTAGLEYAVQDYYRFAGRSAEAIQLLEESLARRRKTLGPENRITVSTLEYLALACENDQRTEEARKLRTELAELQVKLELPSEDTKKIWVLGSRYQRERKFEEAALLYEKALPELTAKYGPDNTEILRLNTNLATQYLFLERYREAVGIMEPVYERAVRTLGATHGVTRGLLQNLSFAFTKIGRQAEAVHLIETALPAFQRDYGPTNHYLNGLLINLTGGYVDLQQYQKGIQLLEETIAAIPEKDRLAYINFESLLQNLEDSHESLGNVTEASRIRVDLERFIRTKEKPESLGLAAGLTLLGGIQIDRDQFAEAERLMREAYAIRASKEPQGWRVNSAKMLLGISLSGQGRFVEAEPFLKDGLEQLHLRSAELPELAKNNIEIAGRTLAILYCKTARVEKGFALCEEANSRIEKSNPTYADGIYQQALWLSVTSDLARQSNDQNAEVLAEKLADRAISVLKRAIAAGYKYMSELKRQHHLDPMRDRNDFKQLLEEFSGQRSDHESIR